MFLFINSVKQSCGIYQYGVRVYSHIKHLGLFEYAEFGSEEEFQKHIQTKHYDAFVLNYAGVLFPWWKHTPNTFYLYHEGGFAFWLESRLVLNTDPTDSFGIPRPLYIGDVTPVDPIIPTFGSFGFGFENKGFERIIDMVQIQYNVAHIRFLIPFAKFGDEDGSRAKAVVARCRSRIVKPGIKLLVCHDFLPNDQVVAFLASNSMNIFLYDKLEGRGCSSVLDYALVAKKPIAISDSHMFRHIYSDAICAYKRPLKSILAEGTRHIEPFLEKWSTQKMCDTLLQRIRNVL